MENINSSIEKFNTTVNDNLSFVHKNEYIFPVVTLFLSLYVALARPKLPNYIVKLLENVFVRLAIISYIIYRGNDDPKLSIMIAGAFLFTMHLINRQKIEKFAEIVNDEPKRTEETYKSMCGR